MDTRERIVRSAARLFLTRSYQAVGVADVCAAADVRKGSFYHFFPSKAELAKAVVDLHAAELRARLAVERPHGNRLLAVADAIAEIQFAFERRFGRVVGCPFGNLAGELSTTDEEVRVHVAAVFARWEQSLARACRQAAEDGELRAGVEPDRLARLILAQAQGLILLAKVSAAPAADIAEGLRAMIATALRPAADTGSVE